jgi:hypothetical protein
LKGAIGETSGAVDGEMESVPDFLGKVVVSERVKLVFHD